MVVSKNMITTQDYYSLDTDGWMHEIKTKDVCKDFSEDKEMFEFSNCSTLSK